jgi:peptidylprolyl isomerase
MLKKVRNFYTAALIVSTGVTFAAEKDRSKEPFPFDKEVKKQTEEVAQLRKLSEAFGHFVGSNLYSPGIKFDLDSFLTGVRNGAAGSPPPLSEDKFNELMTIYQEKAFIELSEANLKDANAFLEDNRDSIDVIEIEKGKLQYEVLKEGKGEIVSASASPLIHFKGKLLDGTVFGSTESRREPITVSLDQAILGLQKGIVKMREGEKRRLYIHPDLGFGSMGDLPPNTVLIFDVEVVKANNPDSRHISFPSIIEAEEPEISHDEETTINPYFEDTMEEPPLSGEEADEFDEYGEEDEPGISDETESDPASEEDAEEETFSYVAELDDETLDKEEIEHQNNDEHQNQPVDHDAISENQQGFEQKIEQENDDVDFLNDDFELPQW